MVLANNEAVKIGGIAGVQLEVLGKYILGQYLPRTKVDTVLGNTMINKLMDWLGGMPDNNIQNALDKLVIFEVNYLAGAGR